MLNAKVARKNRRNAWTRQKPTFIVTKYEMKDRTTFADNQLYTRHPKKTTHHHFAVQFQQSQKPNEEIGYGLI